MATWMPRGVPDVPADEARAELARRWLRSFGPATTDDLKWWAGWTVAQTKAALAAVAAVEVELDAGPGWVLPDDVASTPTGRWVALLPSLDPTIMGWRDRDWYLGEHGPALFDSNGNAGPTVWVDGRVVGGWVHRSDGRIAVELLEKVGRDARRSVDRAAAELERWLGDVRVTPRFPTPLQTGLRGS
jgi:hypothetical protein